MANKKINQLVSKTAILSTDIFGIGDATTGQLFKKTIAELQAAIGGAVISVNGLVGTVVLDTDDIQELATPTNKYFTDARARGAISLTVTGNSGASTYSSGTGVLNVPTYTLAGLGGITASFLSGTSGISYNSTTGVISYSGTVYTDSSIRALLSGSTGISYNSTTGAISYSGTVYTDSSVRALISMTTTGNSGASTYNNTTGVINVPDYTLAGLGGISLTSLSGGTGITYNSSTGAISYSGTVYTDASVRALISASGAVSYNNTTGVISLTSGNLTEATSSVLTITGGTGAVLGSGTSIQVKQATTSVSGFLSSTDWTTFNNKQATITLTTTGTSGSATFSANTLNIPNYGSALSGYLPLTGGTLTGALSGTSASFSSTLTSVGATINGANNAIIDLYNTALADTNARNWRIVTNDSAWGSIEFKVSTLYNNAPSSTKLTIASTGAATFSSSVTAGKGTFVANNEALKLQSSDTNGAYLTISPSTGADIGYIGSNFHLTSGGSATDLAIRTTQNLIFDAGGATERMRITSTGNVGVGTTAPASKLDVVGDARFGDGNNFNPLIQFAGSGRVESSPGYSFVGDLDTGMFNPNTGNTLAFATGGTERMRITSGGNVGIGTSSPLSRFDINNTYVSDTTSQVIIRDNTGGGLLMGGTGGAARWLQAQDYTGAATYYNLLLNPRGGNILLGTTTDNGERLYVSGAIRATSTITANSDIRIKSNITKIENALEKVGQISGYTYNTTYDDKRHGGVIAQEIDKVFPEIVNTGNDGLMGVEYGNISALLIEAIKEQNIKIKNLETLLASK